MIQAAAMSSVGRMDHLCLMQTFTQVRGHDQQLFNPSLLDPPYSPGSCYAMGVTAEGADPETWVAVPCEGVDRYDCVCLEILGQNYWKQFKI